MISVNFIPDLTTCADGIKIDSNGVTKKYHPSVLGKYKKHKEVNGKPSFKHVHNNWYLYPKDSAWRVSAPI